MYDVLTWCSSKPYKSTTVLANMSFLKLKFCSLSVNKRGVLKETGRIETDVFYFWMFLGHKRLGRRTANERRNKKSEIKSGC